VLKACRDYKLKKCVFTSSISTVNGNEVAKEVYTDEDWVDENSKYTLTYPKSKILAEKMVWDFRKNLSKDSSLKLLTINPALVIGMSMNPRNIKKINKRAKLVQRTQAIYFWRSF
jgi:nucleoside-diphosphate-sugar epimerase